MQRKISKFCFFIVMLVFFSVTTMPVQAGFWDDYVKPVVDVYQNTVGALQYLDTDPKGQQIMYQKIKKDTGVSNDAKANKMLNDILQKLLISVKASEEVRASYIAYVNPHQDMNAFATLGHIISINDGTFVKANYNEDEIAFIIAHEMAHIQGKHTLINSAINIPMTQLDNAYKNGDVNQITYVMSNVTMKNLLAYGINRQFEWLADNNGWQYFVGAGFNPGAPAAMMVRIRSIYGEMDRDFFEQVLSPDEHPTMTERINNLSEKLTKYSNDQIEVKGNTIYFKGMKLYTVADKQGMSGEEQAYLYAGKIVQYMKQSGINETVSLDTLKKILENLKM